MATNDYKVDRKGMDAFVRSGVVGDAMFDVANDALAYARSIAPVQSGSYRDSLYAEQVMVPVGSSNEMRAGAMIATNADHGAAVENRYHVLSRTADHMS